MKRTSSPWLQSRSKALRSEMTPHERIMWRILRDGELRALNWRRQAVLGAYILDFVSHPARLVVEADGAQHAEDKQIDHDARRTAWLKAEGYQVLRFWNYETKAAQNEIWLTVYAAASKTPALTRMQRWKADNTQQTAHANAHLPLDGGGGREAAGGGACPGDASRVSKDLGGENSESHPLSHAARDSSPIEGERE